MSMTMQALATQQSLRQWWLPFDCLAIVASDGTPIDIKYQTPSDLGTLPVAAEVFGKYLNLGDGDIALTNDPYSGGSLLSNLTFVTRVVPGKSSGMGPITLVSQIPLKPWVSLVANLNEEGLRIPPTPIFQSGHLNRPLLEAMSSHPLSPREFSPNVDRMIQLISQRSRLLKSWLEKKSLDLSDAGLKRLNRLAGESYERSLESLSSGQIIKGTKLEDQSRIRLSLDYSEDHFKFDFSGSTESKQFAMTDSATLGACISAVLSVVGQPIPINRGFLSYIQLVAPRGSIVNAQMPQPVFRGMTDGVMLVANLALNAICEIDGNRDLPVHGISQCAFSIEFSGDRKFFDSLEPGTAASKTRPGEDTLNIWKRSALKPSVEEIERRFPLRIKSFAIRTKSGGSGQYVGGNGSTKVIEVLENARVTWITSQDVAKPSGALGGKTAHGPEVAIYSQGKKKDLDASGTIELKAGDSFVMHSPGGGGFGEVSTPVQTS